MFPAVWNRDHPVSLIAAQRLHQEKFEACVTPGARAEAVMEAARTSPSNSRLILYGNRRQRAGSHALLQVRDQRRLPAPLERPSALKLVRATHMLVRHEFRRYARIPIMTEVTSSVPMVTASAPPASMSALAACR
jgi:hypothetical protein